LKRCIVSSLLCLVFCFAPAISRAEEPTAEAPKTLEQKLDDVNKAIEAAKVAGDSAWMLISTALVMFMVPGLALFYGGMVRRKNILATMMQSMVCLAVVGVFWIGIGYSLAFGPPVLGAPSAGFLGFSPKLVFLNDVKPDELIPGGTIPIYLHMLFQGMFAIITPALISGALAERIRFKPYLIFVLLWVTLIYCPLAHMVWAMDWWHTTPLDAAKGNGATPCGYLGAMGALDFAGGTVVHIAAGFSSLAAILVLRKRLGYPEQAFHPNSMVLCLTGAGLLWFGWFGFNGGSATASGTLATSAFAATQAAAAAAGLSWLLAEWLHKGKPTALGLASGIVAGLVAVTPASGYVLPWGGLVIGLIAGVVCYASVCLKPLFGYDDSLDAFGVHGVGGFLGAILTGVFCVGYVNSGGADGVVMGSSAQLGKQFIAAALSAVIAFVGSIVLVKLVDMLFGFVASDEEEITGLDRIEHGEVGFDLSLASEAAAAHGEPRPATAPPGASKRFAIVVEGINNGELMHAWSALCQPGSTSAEFRKIYPHVTTVQGNRFRFRGGDENEMRDNVQRLFQGILKSPIKAHVE
jgi:ammonium transporter